MRIGIFTSLSSGFLADLLGRFVLKYPRIRQELVEGGPAQHVSAVVRNQMDVAFLTGEPRAAGCKRLHLWDERVFVALPADDALVETQEIAWSELRGRQFIVSESDAGPEIQNYLIKHLADLGHYPSFTRHSVARDNLLNLVAMKQGITITTEATIASLFPGVVYRPLMNETLPFCAIWAINNENPALHRLLSLARLASRNWLPENDFPIHTRRRVATSPGAIA
jgi:DNA-binding transcriptional LysR family regulator